MKIEWNARGNCRTDGQEQNNSYPIVANVIRKHCETAGIRINTTWGAHYTHEAEISAEMFTAIRVEIREFMTHETERMAAATAQREKTIATERRQKLIDGK